MIKEITLSQNDVIVSHEAYSGTVISIHGIRVDMTTVYDILEPAVSGQFARVKDGRVQWLSSHVSDKIWNENLGIE